MKIAVTGANGFIGQQVVAEALQQGHEVCAIVRQDKSMAWQSNAKLRLFECDLLQAEGLVEALEDCEAVIHLAAVMTGSKQYHDTMTATGNLLKAMMDAQVKTLIALSSIAVLDYAATAPFSEIDESLPLAPKASALGLYAKMKRDQEKLLQKWEHTQDEQESSQRKKRLVILRPGLVYDQHTLSPAHAGFKFIAVNHGGEVPVVHVKAVATAAVAALTKGADHSVFHLINDNPPSQSEYLLRLKERNALGSTLYMPWRIYLAFMGCLRLPLQLIGKCPDAMHSNSVAARQKPYKFSNRRAKQHLNWHPHQGLKA